MVERLTSIKRYSADWQRVDKWRVIMTTLLQKFQHSSASETIFQHICPRGMKDVITRLLGHLRCLNPNVLPKQLRNDHPLLIQTYKKEEWTLVIANAGAKEPADYQRLYCIYCQTLWSLAWSKSSKEALVKIHLWIPSLQLGMLWKYPRSIWTMLVASYHRILSPKQDRMLASSSGTIQNILKHRMYILWPQNHQVKSWKGNLLIPRHHILPKRWH